MVHSARRVAVLVLLMVAPVALSSATAEPARAESQRYVAQWTTQCGVNDNVEEMLRDLWGDDPEQHVPGAPSLPDDPQVDERPCFAILPGEAAALLRVTDDVSPRVGYWVGVGAQEGTWWTSGLYCSDETVVIPLPEGATRMGVTVLPASAAGCSSAADAPIERVVQSTTVGTTGTIQATFS